MSAAEPARGAATAGAPARSYEYAEGWGMTVGARSRILRPRSVQEIALAFQAARSEGAHIGMRGSGCSYGDASVNAGGHLLDVRRMNRVLSFDRRSGVCDVEAGVTIEDLWKHVLPHGYWPRVVSGTMFPTVGGTAAMNIHGKNNFKVGSFGECVEDFDIVLPSGEVRTCSREQESDLFHAAIGGFGMLGCISRVRLKTTRVHSGDLAVKAVSVHGLAEMMSVFDRERAAADYLVGWIDCFAGGPDLGRGLVHVARYLEPDADLAPRRTLSVRHQELPSRLLGVLPRGEVWRLLRFLANDRAWRGMCYLKYQLGRLDGMRGWYRQSHAAFNFLLDYVPDWKFAYGRRDGRGLIQYQSFLPADTAHEGYREILARCRRAGHVSYLGVFKRHRPDPFWMTHANDGWSLALDFPVTPDNRASLWSLCDELTRVVLEAGGKFYFAKDLVLGHQAMLRAFPAERREAFLALKRELDPEGLIETNLWRRIFTPGEGLTSPA